MCSSSESDDESGEDDYGDDDNWSGANGYLETAIYQALFSDVALAAYLISKMYGMVFLGSLKKISRKVSSWRERIITCAGTTISAPAGLLSTEKVVPAKGPTSDLGVDRPKRKKLGESTGSNINEKEDDDDDRDENRRKRLKESNIGSGLVMPSRRLACPFNKMDHSKYRIQYKQEGVRRNTVGRVKLR